MDKRAILHNKVQEYDIAWSVVFYGEMDRQGLSQTFEGYFADITLGDNRALIFRLLRVFFSYDLACFIDEFYQGFCCCVCNNKFFIWRERVNVWYGYTCHEAEHKYFCNIHSSKESRSLGLLN